MLKKCLDILDNLLEKNRLFGKMANRYSIAKKKLNLYPKKLKKKLTFFQII